MKKLTIFSFGFKYRRPPANNYFDVSFIKNPARDKRWNLFSEIDKDMKSFVIAQPFVDAFLFRSRDFISLLCEADDDCRVAFGCSAGRHRSPIIAELVAKELAMDNINSIVIHLEKENKNGIL